MAANRQIAVSRAQFTRLLAEVKGRIQQAQTRAVLAVNSELVRLYWDIGRLIDDRQRREGWGAAVIPRLARALHNELPELRGFSERNIDRMIAFYRSYPHVAEISPPVVAKLAPSVKVPQAVAKLAPAAKVQAQLAQLPAALVWLKSQFVTSSWGGLRRAAPYAFTEQGVAMLSSELRSRRAVMVNIEIMRAFVRLRQMLVSNAELARKLAALERRYDAQFKVVFDAIRELMNPPEAKRKRSIGFAAWEEK